MKSRDYLLKDIPTMNHRSENKKYLKMIADVLRRANAAEDYNDVLKCELLKNRLGEKEHKKCHKGCNGCDTVKLTEKRICRCMYYYNTEDFPKERCKTCSIRVKWNNVGKIRVTEHEEPTKYVVDNLGGMDLIFDNQYAVEVKPYKNKESLARMFAEILTYTIESQYKPAICFFEHSVQRKDFVQLYNDNNEDLLYLMQCVKVFYISCPEIDNEFSGIVDFEIKEIEDLL